MNTSEDRPVHFINLTGHPLDLTDGVHVIRLLPAGRARIRTSMRQKVTFVGDGGLLLPGLESEHIQIDDLPEPSPGIVYIVSGMVADAANRADVWAPARKLRSEQGIKGARALIRNWKRIGDAPVGSSRVHNGEQIERTTRKERNAETSE